METLNTMRALQPRTPQLQVGDIVGFDTNVENFPLAIGTILSIKPKDEDRGTDECIVVQVGPKVLGIYRAEQLVLLRNAELQPEVNWNGCAPTV
jgi:hypothetical protein